VPLPCIGVFAPFSKSLRAVFISLLTIALFTQFASAQETLGSMNGTASDPSGAVVQGARVKIRAVATNLEVAADTKNDGSFSITDLPIGTYEVKFVKDGFETVDYLEILVQGNRTTTVNAKLRPGAVSSTVTVEGTPLLNETDNANGYTLGPQQIEDVPLGTGSFTQLAILAPGVSADFLSGSGSNEGLGNQGIVANGQRDTSNLFTFNGVNANNLFNGNSTSNISDSRFTLNTGEIFGVGGQVQTNSSVFDAIGQALPTPPVETIQEVHVTTSMYDASMGSASGAHVETTTKSGTNAIHGQLYEYFQNNVFDAAPTFLAQNPFFSGAPPLHRNVFGATLGGPIKKNKMFFFGSYQGQRISDALSGAFNGVPTLPGLTDAIRNDPTALVNLVNADDTCGQKRSPACITDPKLVDPVALAILQAKAGGQFIIPSSNAANPESGSQPFNAFIKGPPSQFNATQVNGNIDYNFTEKERLAGKYYFQSDPTSIPFAVSQVVGFPQTMHAASQLFSLDSTTVLTPNTTWENRYGFIREVANATTAQALTPSNVGLNLLGSTRFPGIIIGNADLGAALEGGGIVNGFHGNQMSIGPSTNFANAGIFQNQHEGSSIYHWVHGRHSMAFGGIFDYTQLNVENRENQVASLSFNTFADFLQGTLGQDHSSGQFLNGETNRHFRSRSAGLFVQDGFKLRPNLTLNAGLRWDWDGPLYEKNGLLTNFYASDYKYNLATDSFGTLANGEPGVGLVVAGNNHAFGFKNVSNSTLTGRQWMFAPRIGMAWSPSRLKNVVVRAGFGIYADRGEYFTELSASAGLGISGPFSVTTQEPFTVPVNATCNALSGCLTAGPFGTAALKPPPSNLSEVAGLIYNQSQLSGCAEPVTPTCAPTGFANSDFLFGGYDPANKLPYSENWSLDLQWQPKNDVVLTMAYIGNHGVHQPIPIPFNEPGVATPTHPINGQPYSYGFQAIDSNGNPLLTEQVQTTIGAFSFSDGNTALRTPYIGFNPNADFWRAEGISTYNALQVQATKRMSHGFMVNASYTFSHSLDEGSGLGAGLFFNGNDPLKPRTAYASSDFDRKHVFSVSYVYQLPSLKTESRFVRHVVNGWGLQGVTVAQSGQPFSVIDFSGTAASIFFSADDFITNPILPLAPGISPKQATQGGTDNSFTSGPNQGVRVPYINPNAFSIPFLNPGQSGVPPCGLTTAGTTVCDTQETSYGGNGRNIFRAPFQTRFDLSLFKNFKFSERVALKFQADAFNIFNHPSFDAPNGNFALNGCFNPNPCFPDPTTILSPGSPNPSNFGVIRQTVGSNRFLQLALHLTF
jgi:Carboxypeptidase regulatory-like domain/TonB dependent receptor